MTPGKFAAIQDRFAEELRKAGMDPPEQPPDPDGPEGPGYGYVAVEFKWFPELIDTAFVIAHVSVPCGTDDAVYAYDFHAPRWVRILADGPHKGWGHTGATVELSGPDRDGRRLLLTHYTSAQCQSTWMGMAFSVHRVSANADHADLLLSTEHGFWLGNDDGPLFVLKRDELIVEFLDGSVDTGIHNRTQLLRYNFADGVRRLDPIAFQPQDFVEEWLTRPWAEVQSRSMGDVKEWHDKLHADFLFGEYVAVVDCPATPNRWLIDLSFSNIGGKDLTQPLEAFFLVHDFGEYRYTMEGVSSNRPDGCPGDGIVSGYGHAGDKHPWLSKTDLEKLR